MDFDADSDADAEGNDRDGIALSGTIDNFMTGDTARPDWSVALMVDDDDDDTNDAAPVDSLVGATNARMLTEWSTGAAQTGTGEWTAMWYGGEGDDQDEGHPMAVTGTFDAHIGGAGAGAVGRLQGAFAAE